MFLYYLFCHIPTSLLLFSSCGQIDAQATVWQSPRMFAMICVHACPQDAGKRSVIDAAREDARLFKIASELADEEERKRQWRVARGEVRTHLCYVTRQTSNALPASKLHSTQILHAQPNMLLVPGGIGLSIMLGKPWSSCDISIG